MSARSWCEIESIRWLPVGAPFTGRVDATGFGVRTASEPGFLITMRGGCECVFVSEARLLEAILVPGCSSKLSPMVGGAKKPKR